MPRKKKEQQHSKAVKGGSVLLGREAEFQRIEALIQAALNSSSENGKRQLLSIYINGVPGTGKTATTNAVVERLQQQKKKFVSLIVNCTEVNCSSASGLYRRVLEQLSSVPGPASRLSSQLNELFNASGKPILIVLDEIDSLVSPLLYKAFEWPVSSKGKVILVGIANSLGLTERLLPKLKTVLSPQVITFTPYSVKQLNDILHQKFATENVDAKAFDLCARKVLAITGDVRQAIDITKRTLNSMKEAMAAEEEEDTENIDPMPATNITSSPSRLLRPNVSASIYSTPRKSLKRPAARNLTPVSACQEVLKLVKKVHDSPLQRSRLPLHPRILLATFMRLLTKSVQNTVVKQSNQRLTTTRARLYTAYFKVCEQLAFQPMGDDDLEGVYNILESQSMISLKTKGGLVVLEVEFELARQVINDDSLLNSIESVSLP